MVFDEKHVLSMQRLIENEATKEYMRLFFRGTHLLLFDGKPQFVDMSLSCVVRVSSDEGVVGVFFFLRGF